MYAEWNDAFLILYRAICLGFSFFFLPRLPFSFRLTVMAMGFLTSDTRMNLWVLLNPSHPKTEKEEWGAGLLPCGPEL